LEDGKKQREDGGRRRRWGGGLGFEGFVSVGIKEEGKAAGWWLRMTWARALTHLAWTGWGRGQIGTRTRWLVLLSLFAHSPMCVFLHFLFLGELLE
jgi:hypothetical protein